MQPFPHGKHIFEVNTLARDGRDLLFLALFRIDDTSNGFLPFLILRRVRAKLISVIHCIFGWHCLLRQRPSGAQMSVCVAFGAWLRWHDLGPFAACSNRTCFVMVSAPLCVRTHVLLCRGARAYGMSRGCPVVRSLTCWRFGPVIALSPYSFCGRCKH